MESTVYQRFDVLLYFSNKMYVDILWWGVSFLFDFDELLLVVLMYIFFVMVSNALYGGEIEVKEQLKSIAQLKKKNTNILIGIQCTFAAPEWCCYLFVPVEMW